MQRKPKSEQSRAEPKQKNMQKNADVQPNVNDDVQPDVNGDVQPDASQAGNNVVASQASSCVVDTSQIGLSQVQAKQKKGRKLEMKMRKRYSERIKLKCFQKLIICLGSSSDQPITSTEHDEGTSTHEKRAHIHDSKLGV